MKNTLTAAVSLSANFIFYVTFVQFALLHHLTGERGLSQNDLSGALGALAVFGIFGSIAAGALLDASAKLRGKKEITVAVLSLFLALTAVASFRIAQSGRLILLFGVLGAALGAQIVFSLAWFATRSGVLGTGFLAGLAAGFSYLAANVIAAYATEPRSVALADAALMAANAALVWFSRNSGAREDPAPIGADHSLGAFLRLLAPLSLLVIVDSFSFYPLGASSLPHPVFASASDWIRNGGLHLLFALAAGLLYARVGFRAIVFAAAVAMVGASVVLLFNMGWDLARLVRWFYSAVVGIYTVGFFAVFADAVPKRSPFLGVAFGVVVIGWLANPVGIALSQALAQRVGLTGLFAFSLLGSIAALALAAGRLKDSAR